MADVCCLGIIVTDIWGKPVDDWPERGTMQEVDEVGIGVGGCAANTGVSLLKLGSDVAIMGKVGADTFGDFVRETLREQGAGTSFISADQKAGTSATLIMVDSSGERTFIHYIGANGTVRQADLDMDVICGSQIFHIAGAQVMPGFDGQPAASVLKQASDAGVVTSVDTVWNDAIDCGEVMAPLFPHTDLFLPNLEEARAITERQTPEDVATALLDAGVRTVALKMGADGVYVRTRDHELTVPAFEVTVLDGTGAGDAFVAGFLRGYLEGWDLQQTAKFASAAGALCVTAMGTTAGVPDLDGVIDFLIQHDDRQWQEMRPGR